MKALKSLLAVALLSTLSTTNAFADGHCLDGNTTTCITEEEIVMFGDPAVEYTIDNNSGERLFAFGVSNEIYFGETSTFNAGWNSGYFSERDWNAGRGMFMFRDAPQHQGVLDQLQVQAPTKVWVSGTGDSNYPYEYIQKEKVVDLQIQGNFQAIQQPEPEIVYLGSFASLFGTEDNGVAFYWNGNEADNPLNDGVELDNFFLASEPNSDFSTFGAQGNVVTTSVAAIPEPETYAMFLAGLGLMGFVARRKQA